MAVKKRVAIFGSKGVLGKSLCAEFMHPDIEIIKINRTDIQDIISYANISELLLNTQADVVFNCIAMNGVNKCCIDKAQAFAINALFPSIVLQACNQLGSRFIHFSTEMVFSNSVDLIPSTTTPNPKTIYGITKFFGEHKVDSKATLIRLPLLLGKSENQQIVWKLTTKLAGGDYVKVASDLISSPVYVEDVSSTIREILLENSIPHGIIHFSSGNRESLLETVRKFADSLGVSSNNLISCNAADYPSLEDKPLRLGLAPSHTFSLLK